MTTNHTHRILPLLAAIAMLAAFGATTVHAAPLPNKFVLSSSFGWDVNQTTGGDICTVASKNTCQLFGKESSEPGGFNYSKSVAVDNDPASAYYGDVYVADGDNQRVQVLAPTGAFVSMFGWDVNKTEDETPGVTQAEKNICTAESNDTCGAGVVGGAPGQIDDGLSIAVDANSGNVYLLEQVVGEPGGETAVGYRVQAFTAAGAWLLEIGSDVNETAETNVCTEREVEEAGVKCGGPTLIPIRAGASSTEHGAFNPSYGGNLLAVGGPEGLLYVGDEDRVQEFNAETGEWKGEIPLTSISSAPGSRVVALAVDETGDVYLAYRIGGGPTNLIRQFNPSGVQVSDFEVEDLYSHMLALDPYGRLAVDTSLYSSTGAKISEFAFAGEHQGLAFAASDELYVAGGSTREVEAYVSALFPEPATCPASQVTATSAVLCGAINANGVKSRGVFSFGPPAGARTPVAFEGEGTTPEAVAWHLSGLVPNETYGYEMTAEAEVAGEEATGSGAQVTFHTLTPRPEVPGAPSVSDVTSAFALLSAQVNPEHAPTRYHFEYGPCPVLEGCGAVASTPDQESSVYGTTGAIQEVVGLQPQSTYSYRLLADNAHEEAGGVKQGGETVGQEGHFTTGALPVPAAQTGAASAVGATSAVIAGLADPDGQSAVYAFELGVYQGSGTRYGIVFSGLAGASVVPVSESYALTGLQSGTTYAYRIVVKSGYGEATGATMTFTTEGLPAVLAAPVSLAQLSVPSIAFPTLATGGGKPVSRKAKSRCGSAGAKSPRCPRSKPRARRKPKHGQANRRGPAGSGAGGGRAGHDHQTHG